MCILYIIYYTSIHNVRVRMRTYECLRERNANQNKIAPASNRLNRLIKSNKSSLSSWPKAANFKLSMQSAFLSYENLSKSKLRMCYPKLVARYHFISLNFMCCSFSTMFSSNVCQCPSQRFHRCLEKKLLPPFICRLTDSRHVKTTPSASTSARQCLRHSMLSLYNAPTLPCARSQPRFSQNTNTTRSVNK